MEKMLQHTKFPNALQSALLSIGCHTHSVIFYHHHRLMLLQATLCSGGPWPQKPGNQHEVWIVFHQKNRRWDDDAETPVLFPSWGTTAKMFSTTHWQGFAACVRRADFVSGSLCCSSYRKRLPFKSHLFLKHSHYAKKEEKRKGPVEVTPAMVFHQWLWPTKRTS